MNQQIISHEAFMGVDQMQYDALVLDCMFLIHFCWILLVISLKQNKNPEKQNIMKL